MRVRGAEGVVVLVALLFAACAGEAERQAAGALAADDGDPASLQGADAPSGEAQAGVASAADGRAGQAGALISSKTAEAKRDLASCAAPSPPLAPTVLADATDQQFLGDVFLNNGFAYFTGGRIVDRPADSGPGPASETFGVLRRVPAAGGAVEELWAGPGGGADVAVGSDAIYFQSYDYFWRTGHVYRLPTSGAAGDVVEVATWQSHGSTHSLTVDGDVAYWTNSTGASGNVNRTALGGAETTLLATGFGSADDILVKGGVLYWFVEARAILGLSLAGGGAEGGNTSSHFTVWESAVGSDGIPVPVTALAPALWDGGGLLAAVGGGVVAVNTNRPGSSRQLAAASSSVITALASDTRFVYYATKASEAVPGQILRLPRQGSRRPTVLVTAQTEPVALAVDDTSVYWVDSGTRTVLKAPKAPPSD